MESSQEAYVTIKYRLENNGSEPKLNDIGARPLRCTISIISSSEPKLNDIGARPTTRIMNTYKCSEPKLNDIGARHTLSILDNILNLG